MGPTTMEMPTRRRLLLAVLLLLSAAVAAQYALGRKKDKAAGLALDQRKRAVHSLNRLAFGPRPGDVDRVTSMGVDLSLIHI